VRVILVRELLVKLGFDADESKVRSFDGAVRSLTIGLTAAVGAMTAAAGAGLRLASFTANSAREIDNMARVANAGTTEFQRFAAAATQVGIEQGKLSDILKDVNDRVGDFNTTGGGPMADFFENIAPQIGITADAFRDLSGPEALQLYYNSLEQAGLSQQEMTFYLEAMASDATALIPLLANNGEALRRLGDDAELLGGILDESAIASAREFNETLRRMQLAVNGLRLQIGAELMPVFRPMIQAFTDFILVNREFLLSNARVFFEQLAEVMGRLIGVVQTVAGWIARLAEAVSNLSPYEQAALAVLGLLFAWQRLGKWFVAAAIVAILDDIAAWMSDQPSLIGRLIGPYAEFAETIAGVVERVGGLENVLRALMAVGFLAWVARAIPAIRGVATALMLLAANPIGAAITAIALGAALIIANWDTVGPALEGVFNFIIETFNRVKEAFEAGFEAINGWVNSGLEAWQSFRDGLGEIVDWLGEKFDALLARIQPILNAGAALAEIGSSIGGAVTDFFTGDGTPSAGSGGRGRGRAVSPTFESGAAIPSLSTPGVVSQPSQPVDDGLSDLRQYLDGLGSASVDVNDGSLSGDVDQSRTANVNVQLSQSITVPPGTTAEQLAVIRRESDAAIERAAERAAAAMEM
jgi:hypothetical protein